MTWFEAEESAKYIFELEAALDEWKYDNSQMRAQLAELVRIEKRLQAVFNRRNQENGFTVLANEVLLRARHCRHEIHERLMA